MTSAGIDAMEIWTGKLVLDLPNTFAPVEDEDPEKYTKGLGLHTSSFPDVYEDIATMGANTTKKLMDRKGLTPAGIGRIDVTTESAFDNSKLVSAYVTDCPEQVHDGDFRHTSKDECKFACIADTRSLDSAYSWIKAGRNHGRAALIITTNTALHEHGDPSEAAQGAGVITILIDRDPDLVKLPIGQDYGSVGKTGFLKPDQQFPSVDGKHSIQVYLTRMREVLEDYESATGHTRPDLFEYIPFHTPFPSMVRRAAPLGFRRMTRDTDIEDDFESKIGHQPRGGDFEVRDGYEEAIRGYMDELKTTEQYRDWYGHVIEPTLDISSRVDSWYTGSVHTARPSTLKAAADEGKDMTGKQLLVDSYGSGAQAKIHTERVRETWLDEIEAVDVGDQLATHTGISFGDYELIHDVHNHGKKIEVREFTRLETEFVLTGWGRISEHHYEYIE